MKEPKGFRRKRAKVNERKEGLLNGGFGVKMGAAQGRGISICSSSRTFLPGQLVNNLNLRCALRSRTENKLFRKDSFNSVAILTIVIITRGGPNFSRIGSKYLGTCLSLLVPLPSRGGTVIHRWILSLNPIPESKILLQVSPDLEPGESIPMPSPLLSTKTR